MMEFINRLVAGQREAHHANAGQNGVAQNNGAIEPDASTGKLVTQVLKKVRFAVHALQTLAACAAWVVSA